MAQEQPTSPSRMRAVGSTPRPSLRTPSSVAPGGPAASPAIKRRATSPKTVQRDDPDGAAAMTSANRRSLQEKPLSQRATVPLNRYSSLGRRTSSAADPDPVGPGSKASARSPSGRLWPEAADEARGRGSEMSGRVPSPRVGVLSQRATIPLDSTQAATVPDYVQALRSELGLHLVKPWDGPEDRHPPEAWKSLGQGSSGTVYRTPDNHVIKRIKRRPEPHRNLAIWSEAQQEERNAWWAHERELLQHILKEVTVLRHLQPDCSAYVLCFKDVSQSPFAYYIRTEHLSGYASLREFLEDEQAEYRAQRTNEQFLATVVVNLMRGVQFMHERHVVHLDIKPDNVMVNTVTGQIKYIDFGVSCIENQCPVMGWYGTRGYMAPEIYLQVTKWDRLMRTVTGDRVDKKKQVELKPPALPVTRTELQTSFAEWYARHGKLPPEWLWNVHTDLWLDKREMRFDDLVRVDYWALGHTIWELVFGTLVAEQKAQNSASSATLPPYDAFSVWAMSARPGFDPTIAQAIEFACRFTYRPEPFLPYGLLSNANRMVSDALKRLAHVWVETYSPNAIDTVILDLSYLLNPVAKNRRMPPLAPFRTNAGASIQLNILPDRRSRSPAPPAGDGSLVVLPPTASRASVSLATPGLFRDASVREYENWVGKEPYQLMVRPETGENEKNMDVRNRGPLPPTSQPTVRSLSEVRNPLWDRIAFQFGEFDSVKLDPRNELERRLDEEDAWSCSGPAMVLNMDLSALPLDRPTSRHDKPMGQRPMLSPARLSNAPASPTAAPTAWLPLPPPEGVRPTPPSTQAWVAQGPPPSPSPQQQQQSPVRALLMPPDATMVSNAPDRFNGAPISMMGGIMLFGGCDTGRSGSSAPAMYAPLTRF